MRANGIRVLDGEPSAVATTSKFHETYAAALEHVKGSDKWLEVDVPAGRIPTIFLKALRTYIERHGVSIEGSVRKQEHKIYVRRKR